jgi:hypothetical protein
MSATISVAMLGLLLGAECHSPIQHRPNETVVFKCGLPEVQGPPKAPFWWLHQKRIEIERAQAVDPVKKKKRKKKRKVRR